MTEMLLLEQEKDNPEKGEQTPRQGFSLGSLVLMAGILLAALALGVQLYNQNQTQPLPGSPAPDFSLTTFDGDAFTLSEYQGEIVVINFWASWCAPCRDEAPDLQALHEDYADRGVRLIGVNYLDIENNARAFKAEFGMTFPSGMDVGDRIANDYRIQGVPETFVIGPDGRVAAAFIAPITYERLAEVIDPLLAQSEAAS